MSISKSTWVWLAFLVFFTLSVASLVNQSQGGDAFINTSSKPTLRVGTEGTYSPFSFRNEAGELTGYDVDVARAVADQMGYEVQFVEAPWDAMLAAFDAGKTDVVFNQASITPERMEKYDFSESYSLSHPALIVESSNTEITSFEDLAGHSSAQSLTSNYGAMAEQLGARLVSTDGFSKAAELVITGKADATLNDDVTLFDYLNQKPNAPLKVVDTSPDAVFVAALLKKDNPELKDAINSALSQLHSNGTLKELSLKYFGRDISALDHDAAPGGQ